MEMIMKMKKAMENVREYGIGYVGEYIASNLEEWRGLNYPAFTQALANANAPVFFESFERAGCVQHLSEAEKVQFEEADGEAYLYNAAVEAAWDELQRLLAEAAE